jgi:hypothetical protein
MRNSFLVIGAGSRTVCKIAFLRRNAGCAPEVRLAFSLKRERAHGGSGQSCAYSFANPSAVRGR